MRSRQLQVSVTSSDAVVLGPNEQRVGLLVSPAAPSMTNNVVYIGFGTNALTNGYAAIVVTVSNVILVSDTRFTLEMIGEQIKLPIHMALNSSGPSTVTIIEVMD